MPPNELQRRVGSSVLRDPTGGGHTEQTAPPPNELQLPCPLKNQMISRCAIVRTNELQSTRHFSQTKPRGGRAKTMKQPCTATLPPNELQCGQRRQHCHSHNQGTRPATICTPRDGQRYNPRPGPRRHPLTHAADMGQTSPQRRHQHKAPGIVPLPGAAAAT